MRGRGTQRLAAHTNGQKSSWPAQRAGLLAGEWRGPDSNRRHPGFQPSALPAELPRRWRSVSLARRCANSREPVDERVDKIRLLQDRVGARLRNRLVELSIGIARERDQADVRMILAEARDCGNAVHERHVQVDHDSVGVQLIRELDCVEPVLRRADDGQIWLVLDQRAQRFEERVVVVRQEDANRRRRRFRWARQGRDVSLAAVSAQLERHVALIGAPLDLGAGRRGVDMGPSAIRYAGLAEHLAETLNIATNDLGNVEAPVAESLAIDDHTARFLPQILALCDRVAKLVEQARLRGETPLVLGGDHSIALGSLVGMAQVHGPGGVIWVDAHGDLNTPETSPSGNVHGMVLAAALDLAGDLFHYDDWTLPAIETGKLALFGVRSLDQGERELLKRLDAKVFTMSEIDKRGVEPCMREAIDHAGGGAFLHLSLDMDAIDPEHAPGVGTPVRGGLSYREAHLAMEIVAEGSSVDSFDVVEVNPVLDRENATGKLAVELVASALGARIL
jgi:arginase